MYGKHTLIMGTGQKSEREKTQIVVIGCFAMPKESRGFFPSKKARARRARGGGKFLTGNDEDGVGLKGEGESQAAVYDWENAKETQNSKGDWGICFWRFLKKGI